MLRPLAGPTPAAARVAPTMHLALDMRGSVDGTQDQATAGSGINGHQTLVSAGDGGGVFQGVTAGVLLAGNNPLFVRHLYKDRNATRLYWSNNIGGKWSRHHLLTSFTPVLTKPTVAMPGDEYATMQVAYTFAWAGVPLGIATGFGRFFGLQFMPPGANVGNQPWLSQVNNVMGWGIRGGNGAVHWVARNAGTVTGEDFTEKGIFGVTAGYPPWPIAFGEYQRVTTRIFSATPTREAFMELRVNGQSMLSRSWGPGTVLPDYGASAAMGFRAYLDSAGDAGDGLPVVSIELAGIEIMMGPDVPALYLS